MAEETIQDDRPEQEPELADTVVSSPTVDEDEFDRLRRKSTLASSVYDDLEMEEEEERSSALSGLSSSQIIILLILLVIDVVAIGLLIYWVATG